METTPKKKKRRLKKKYRRALQLIGIFTLLMIVGIILEKTVHRRSAAPGEDPKKAAEEEIVIGHGAIVGVPSYKKEFDDSNSVQLAAAERYGIKPVADREAAAALSDKLVLIEDGSYYIVDTLKHSVPYLTFQAAGVLETIGRNFRDSLYAKGRIPHRLVITSILRTEADVAVLRRRNVNASPNSTHRYATTFDIAYARYADSDAPKPAGLREVEPWEMRKVLAEVLRDLRAEGLIYVKYETRQPCFHITARR